MKEMHALGLACGPLPCTPALKTGSLTSLLWLERIGLGLPPWHHQSLPVWGESWNSIIVASDIPVAVQRGLTKSCALTWPWPAVSVAVGARSGRHCVWSNLPPWCGPA